VSSELRAASAGDAVVVASLLLLPPPLQLVLLCIGSLMTKSNSY